VFYCKNTDTTSVHTFAFIVTVVPLKDGVVLVTFLAVDVGDGCTAPVFTLIDVRAYWKITSDHFTSMDIPYFAMTKCSMN